MQYLQKTGGPPLLAVPIERRRGSRPGHVLQSKCLSLSSRLLDVQTFRLSDVPTCTASPYFRPRSSTSVLLKIESFLYRESYCYLGLTRIHSPFNEEDFFDRFRTPHYPALFHAAAAHRPLDDGSRGW